jgi:putative hydrolase of the HAD superfamily
MIGTIILDLSEVLIAGLLGVEKPLSAELQLPEDVILAALGGELLRDLFCGEMSEDSYLARVIERQRWDVSTDTLKQAIRQNLERRVDGMETLVRCLADAYELVLHSDHAVEWIAYVRDVHPFLEVFAFQVFSFDLQQTKEKPSTFRRLLERIEREARECLFVDDNPGNVHAARDAGIESIVFKSAGELAGELARRGLLEPKGTS